MSWRCTISVVSIGCERREQTWATLQGEIDDERYTAISKKFAIQERDAVWWRDACLLYFQTFAKRPLPAGVEKPAHTLAEYKAKALEW